MKQLLIAVVVVLIVLAVLAVRPLLRGNADISTDTAGVRVVLYGLWGPRYTVGPTTEARTVKAGIYRPAELFRELKKGAETWQLYSQGPWGNLERINVKEGEATVLSFGDQLKVGVDTTTDRYDRVVYLSLKLTGPYGETYSPLIKRNGKNVDAPGFVIYDEAGKELAVGKFAYG
ncbi:MAG TPA: hypothetical protein P5279_09125 [Anaerohalosphaeraceae bacterium]|jgi:hypothetical protein|nr:hypothetical protein [Anaerohalosphaeraceae bacterium]HRT50641.1 hypothetical protein [Anaerohalosphaeraceae bacterium]HRT86534.1 hypothetical protein [Anaerohalosphaeraceae bacterium]